MSAIDEDVWLTEQQLAAAAYLEREGIANPELGEEPAFHVSPYISVLRQLLWVVEGTANKGIWHVKPIAKYWEYFVRCWAWLSHGA